MFARTKRLTLRPGWPEDAPALAAAAAHEAVATRLARMSWPYREEDAAAYLAVPRGPADPRFLIWSHETACPRLVGAIGLTPGEGAHELGYWIVPDAWGRGYATEAAAAVVATARDALPIRRLSAWHHLDNPASARVLAKLGFRESARAPRYSLARDREVDSARHDLDLEDRCEVAMAA
jgi:RimJ/RimL family protein N-acetyltransferase